MSTLRVIGEQRTGHGVTVLEIAGEIDQLSSPQFRERIFWHISAGRRRLLLDLTQVTFLDTAALGVLVAAVLRLGRDDASGTLAVVCPHGRGFLSVVCPHERVRRTFQIAGLDAGIGLYRSREQALAALALEPREGRLQPRRVADPRLPAEQLL